jgi:serine/threonine protein kinase
MPLAAGDLTALCSDLSDEDLRDVLCDVADALAAAHAAGFVHRDVTPMNILMLAGDDRWVLADWGLVRRPRGLTTTRLTGSGQPAGADGFMAPELLRGAHRHASPASDVFSLGRVAAWAVAGEPLLPSGPFGHAVREATHESGDARCSLDRFVELLDDVGYNAPFTPHELAEQLGEDARAGDPAAAERLLDHADQHRDDLDLFYDVLPAVRADAQQQLAARDPQAAGRLANAMREHLTRGDRGGRGHAAANAPLRWLFDMCAAAINAGDQGLLEDSADALFESAAERQQFEERNRTRKWLNRLQHDEAAAVARALHRQPRAADWYADEAWQPSSKMDRRIRAALM